MTEIQERWQAVLDRAHMVATIRKVAGSGDEGNWDFLARRGLIAIVLYALAKDDREVDQVPLEEVRLYLSDPAEIRRVVEARLSASGHDLSDEGDPVAAQWAWLTRLWPQSSHAEMPSGGWWNRLTRSVSRGSQEPALQVMHRWAMNDVEAGIRLTWVDIRGLDRPSVLAVLYNNAAALNSGVLDPRSVAPMTAEEATAEWSQWSGGESGARFDYVRGRLLKVALDDEVISPYNYDQEYGLGAMSRVIEHLRATGSVDRIRG